MPTVIASAVWVLSPVEGQRSDWRRDVSVAVHLLELSLRFLDHILWYAEVRCHAYGGAIPVGEALLLRPHDISFPELCIAIVVQRRQQHAILLLFALCAIDIVHGLQRQIGR